MNKTTYWVPNFTLLISFSLPAFADQSTYISQEQAIDDVSIGIDLALS